MPRKLKVFAAAIGFYETVVAVPSRVAAQRAWGVHQDLFKAGVARETDDATAAKAALAKPGVVLRRPLGGKGAFKPEPEGVPVVKALRTSGGPRAQKSKAKPQRAKPPPKPDRSELARAEGALTALAERRRDELAALKAEAAALATRRRESDARFAAAKREAEQTVEEARRRYRAAGGR